MLMRVTDYLELHLLNWATWMRHDIGVRGYPQKALGLATGGASEEFDHMLEDEEKRIARVTDTVINDLPPIQRCALHHCYLHAVFRFRDYTATLDAARDGVRAGLKRKGIWMGEL